MWSQTSDLPDTIVKDEAEERKVTKKRKIKWMFKEKSWANQNKGNSNGRKDSTCCVQIPVQLLTAWVTSDLVLHVQLCGMCTEGVVPILGTVLTSLRSQILQVGEVSWKCSQEHHDVTALMSASTFLLILVYLVQYFSLQCYHFLPGCTAFPSLRM